MARYTTELRDIANSGVKIFNFEYAFYDETKRPDFEQRFIDHFYFREIGQETFGRFQHYLKVKCNEVLPYYNELLKAAQLNYEILNNYNITETLEKTNILTKQLNENSNQTGQLNTTVIDSNTNERTLNTNTDLSKTSTLESNTEHTDNVDFSKSQDEHEESTNQTNTTIDIDNKKVESDTPSGLLSMSNIKNNVYASKADIEDNTNITNGSEAIQADKTGTTNENTSTTSTDNVNGTTTDNGTTSSIESLHDTRTGTSQNNTNNTQSSQGSSNETNNGNENYTLKRVGNIGVSHATDMIEKHIELQRKIRTVYTQFFNECEDLFMQIF
jgi:hypothetical protein